MKRRDDESRQPEGRRDFLKILLAAGWVSMIAATASVFRFLSYIPLASSSETTTQLSWPRIKLANISSLETLKPLMFNYPLVNTPNVLVKLGIKAENGAGPDDDIVAYSIICQHLGCYFAFQPPGSSPLCDSSFKASLPEGYCCCHGGQYDFTQNARVIDGPPPRPVPAVQLEFDSATGDIYAVGMGPPTIFGHGPPGTTDPSSVLIFDLQGGEVVTQETAFSGS
jgi:arsenite oxidase small subunit